ncbi:hypothetical protein [Allofournierella massiliensis]|uniref:hypothetical protein n=1 Tax=Allofournierella massiliensis TaxID=1650663 RepID=UPI00356B148B
MTDDELLFFDSMPQMLPIYQALCHGLEQRGLAFTAKVGAPRFRCATGMCSRRCRCPGER